MDSRIFELERRISRAAIVYQKPNQVIVKIGCKVGVLIDNKIVHFLIVGAGKANLLNNSVSATSPLGIATLDKKVGDEVMVKAPRGSYSCKIVYIG
ncbi:GreA/GreB family elongation factor [Patescibacteria group bacterium]|nr:GreA/GreB family elongation factor [Patescibacteria group bacterium]